MAIVSFSSPRRRGARCIYGWTAPFLHTAVDYASHAAEKLKNRHSSEEGHKAQPEIRGIRCEVMVIVIFAFSSASRVAV